MARDDTRVRELRQIIGRESSKSDGCGRRSGGSGCARGALARGTGHGLDLPYSEPTNSKWLALYARAARAPAPATTARRASKTRTPTCGSKTRTRCDSATRADRREARRLAELRESRRRRRRSAA